MNCFEGDDRILIPADKIVVVRVDDTNDNIINLHLVGGFVQRIKTQDGRAAKELFAKFKNMIQTL